jgi:tetratricopeptide (TPR) repeat protein
MLEPVRRHARRRLELAGRAGAVADAHASWALAAGDRMEAWWSGDDAIRSMRELRGRRADLVVALAHLGACGRADDVDRLARQIGMVLIEHPDVGFSTLIPTITGDSIDGAAARAIIGSSVGRPRPEELHDLRRALGVIADDDPRRHFLRFAFVPAQQYQGDIDGAVATCRLMITDADTPPRLRVLAVSMWALAEAFMGRFDEAERVLAEHAEVLELTDIGGFVDYVRAEVAGGTDTEEALRHVDRAIRLSDDAPDSFVAASANALHLSLLVHSGRTAEAAELALDLAPDLLAAGTVPHAWRALRASAHVLNTRGDHTTAARVLATAEHDPRAPVVLGHWTATIERQWTIIDDALGAERVDQIRRECASLSIAELWSEVEAALIRSAQ